MRKEELIKMLETLTINEVKKFTIEFYKNGDWDTNRELVVIEMEEENDK